MRYFVPIISTADPLHPVPYTFSGATTFSDGIISNTSVYVGFKRFNTIVL